MDKVDLKLYVDLMNKYEEEAKLGITMIFTTEEQNLMKYMKKMALKDDELKAFLNKLTNMTYQERYKAIEERFSDESLKEEPKEFITLEEVKDYKDEIDLKTKEERNKLNYLINNYNKLKVQGIRLKDLKYLDENGELQDIEIKKEKVETPHRNKNYDKLEEKQEKTKSEEKEPIKSSKKEKNKQANKKSGLGAACILFLATGIVGSILAIIILLILSK